MIQRKALSLTLPILQQKRTEIACQMSHQLMSRLLDQIISLIQSGREMYVVQDSYLNFGSAGPSLH
jgi:hypothetical protein